MSESGPPRRPLLRWWESRTVVQQLAMACPALVGLFFALNLGPFGQPLGRSAVYGLVEGGLFTGLLLVATAQERARRP